MRELAEASRTETASQKPAESVRAAPVTALSADTAAVVRARLSGAVPEMIELIGHAVPEYANWPRPDDQQRLADAVTAVGEAVFAYLDELAAACAQGYAEARVQTEEERQRRSRRLLGTILSEPPPGAELLAGLARTVGWVLPAQVAVAALGEWRQQDALVLPPDVLADVARPDPCLLVPDPDGPGRQAAIDRALRGLPAAIGPSVPLARAAMSLRWARHALALTRAGVIPAARGPVRCDQHLSTLLILADEDLAGALRSSRLAPLARLRPGQRDRIAETLLAWLQLGENAAAVAHQLHVHPQTVRYRLRQIQELFGDQLRDPERRFELQLALRVRTLTGRKGG
jgi:PucR-like helix-turn-helix protein